MKKSKNPTYEMIEALDHLKLHFEQICEMELVRSKLQKHKYDSLINEGFTEQQALELCKVTMI